MTEDQAVLTAVNWWRDQIRERISEQQLSDFRSKLEEIAKLAEEKASVEMKIKSTRSILAHYVEKNLIKYPNNDPSKNPEV